jgi:hypothetical protein
MSDGPSHDQLLRALGQLAREQRREKTPPAELLEPPSEAIKERVVAQAIATLGAHAEKPAGHGTARAVAPGSARRPRWWLWLPMPLALAAGLAFWLRTGPAALPSYAMETGGGAAAYRAGGRPDAGDPMLVAAGAPIEIRLRPAVDSTQAVAARAFWVSGSEVRVWQVATATSPGGAVRMRGAGERPFGTGAGELVAVIAAAGALPATISAAVLASPPAGWQVFRRAVRWP